MASVQERLQLKRVPLENWTISEQLHLASAVACGGDQNWMSVSRSLKMVCGQNRPADWFSQKSCAAQYEKLLENAGTSKRKKRSEKDTAAQVVETPIELIVRRLTQERVAELNKLIQDERDEYISIKAEVEAVQNGEYDEEHLREMCVKIEAEEKQREKDKAKYNQWLKEREERKREFEKNWRTNSNMLSQQQPATTPPQPIKIEEMEIIDDSNTKQATSPLLTSLLKSPSAAPNPSSAMLNTMPNQSRVSAPTITNLLTTGTVPNMTALTQASTSGGIVYSTQMQNQPLSGPAASSELYPGNLTPTPSQAAPTLSMLLESKHKDSPTKLNVSGTLDAGTSKHESHADLTPAELAMKDEDQQLMDAFSDLIPDDIDVLAGMILDDLISEEQDAAVSSVAECLENEAMKVATELPVGDPGTGNVPCDAASLMGLVDIKGDANNVNDNACDGMEFTQSTGTLGVAKGKTMDVGGGEEKFQPKDEDSSDLSNDTPLSELIRQEASAKQQRLLQEQQLEVETKEPGGEVGEQQQSKQDEEPDQVVEGQQQQQQQQQHQQQQQAQVTEQQTLAEQTEADHLQQIDQDPLGAGLDQEPEQLDELPSTDLGVDDGDDGREIEQDIFTEDLQPPLDPTGSSDPGGPSDDPLTSIDQDTRAKESADAENSSNGPESTPIEPASVVDPMDFLASDSNDNDSAPPQPSITDGPADDIEDATLADDGIKVADKDETSKDSVEPLDKVVDNELGAQGAAEVSNEPEVPVAVDANVTKNHDSDTQSVNGTPLKSLDTAISSDQQADGDTESVKGGAEEVLAPASDSKADDILTDDEGDEGKDGDETMKVTQEEVADEMAVDKEQKEVATAEGEEADEVVIGEGAIGKNEGNGKTGGLEESVDGGVNGDKNLKDAEKLQREDLAEAEGKDDERGQDKSEPMEEASEKPEQTPVNPEKIDSPNPSASESVDSATKSTPEAPDTEALAPAVVAIEAVLMPSEIKTEVADTEHESSNEDPFAFVGDGGDADQKTVKSELRTSTDDDELFEDAKETLDDSGERKEKPAVVKDETKPLVRPIETPPVIAAIVETDTATTSKTTTPTPSVTIDTDDDAPIEVIKEYKGGRKRDYSRRRHDTNQSFDKSVDDTADDNSSISSRLRMKDRDRSESPYVDDDLNEPLNKYKRRYSSTPIPDSLPNSPASSEDREREWRGWKKSIMLVYNSIHDHRFASIFAKPINDDQYRRIVLNPMDLQTLKRNIDSGTIRTTIDFKRAVMFMCHNALFYNMFDEVTCDMAKTMLDDALQRIDDFNETWLREKENEKNATSSSSATKAVRGRKSTRLN